MVETKDIESYLDNNISMFLNYVIAIGILMGGAALYLMGESTALLFFTPLGMMVFGATIFLVTLILKAKEDMGPVPMIGLSWLLAVIMVLNLDAFAAWGLIPMGGTTLGLFGMVVASKNTKYDIPKLPSNMVGLPEMSESNWAGVGKFCCIVLVIGVLLSALAFLLFGVSIIIPW